MLAISVYVGEKKFSYDKLNKSSVTELMTAAKTLHPDWTSLVITVICERKRDVNT